MDDRLKDLSVLKVAAVLDVSVHHGVRVAHKAFAHMLLRHSQIALGLQCLVQPSGHIQYLLEIAKQLGRMKRKKIS